MKKKYLGKTRKIRTISLDSDVIIDILALKLLQSKSKLTKEDKKYLRRCETSFNVLSLISASKIRTVGISVIKKELYKFDFLRSLYDRVFDEEIPIYRDVRRLTDSYAKILNIKPADIAILASVTVGKIDCFLSWNREHIVNPKVIEKIKKINKSRNLPTPQIITPEDFLERIFLSQDRTLCFSTVPIPRRFRPSFYPSKRLL